MPVDRSIIAEELRALPPESVIFRQANFTVFLVRPQQIPQALPEVGRLRELTFRQVGEGTGQPLDLDKYDEYYLQLLIWDTETEQIVGGYRLGPGAEIYSKFGKKGFYISSLFKIKDAFGEVLKKSVELGRSFVLAEYQKKRLPLFLLWKGILHYLLEHPGYRYLIGPVSVSKFYSDLSRSLIVAFVKEKYYDRELAPLVSARKAFQYRLEDVDLKKQIRELENLEALENFLEHIEPDHIRLPVLLKQYVRQNAKFIGFNLDPNFNDALDGLMLLDMYEVRQETIENLKKQW